MSHSKYEVVKINLSTPFVVRSRCKVCGNYPSIYYYIRNPVIWNDPRRMQEYFSFYYKHIKRLCSNYYLNDSPTSFTSANFLSEEIPFRSFKPKLHHTRGFPSVYNYTEFITCKCGGSVWAYTDKSIRSRLEISMRKSRSIFPQKFNFC